MNLSLRTLVRERAAERCEYCGSAQEIEPFLRYHIEHVIPRQHGGQDILENLALACPRCNLHKGTNLTGIDPETGEVVMLFHPRRHIWSHHFAYDGFLIVGLSPIGRATVWLLKMNDADRVELRMHL